MALDLELHRREQRGGLLRGGRVVAGRRIGGHAHDLAQEFDLLAVMRVDPARKLVKWAPCVVSWPAFKPACAARFEAFEKAQQHRGRDLGVLGGHRLVRMMADAVVAAADEQHRGRRDRRKNHRIVTGAAWQVSHRNAVRFDGGGKCRCSVKSHGAALAA